MPTSQISMRIKLILCMAYSRYSVNIARLLSKRLRHQEPLSVLGRVEICEWVSGLNVTCEGSEVRVERGS